MSEDNTQPPVSRGFWKTFIKPFKANWAESIHFVLIALGIIVSGYWAYHTFDILGRKETAENNLLKTESDLHQAKLDLDKTNLELKELKEKIDGTISSDITIDVQKHPLNNGNTGLIINVTIKNNGTQDIDMKWETTPINIYKVAHSEDKISSQKLYKPYIYRSLKTKPEERSVFIDNLYLFVGAKKDLSFFVEVESDNLYFIAFEANADVKTQESLNGKTGTWMSSKYVFVEENKKPLHSAHVH